MKIVITLFLFCCLTLNAQSLDTFRHISTLEIAETTTIEACTDCIDWKVIGICFWLHCSLFECDIRESTKYSHFIPDLVVSSYTSRSPWTETENWNPAPDGAMSKTESPLDQDTFLNFKSVDIIAHPALPIFEALEESGLFCKSQLRIPLLPHYLSGIDPNWIDPDFERLYPMSILGYPVLKATDGSFLPGVLSPYWAPVYPRCGWGAHPLDPINGAVAAFRASHILTDHASLHVMVPAEGSCGNKCWKPKPVKENKDSDNKFQLIFPEIVNSADEMGGRSASWANGKNLSQQGYMWNLWRKYKCCKDRGSYLFSVDWE